MTDPFFADIHCVAFYSLTDFVSYFLFTQDEILLLHDWQHGYILQDPFKKACIWF